MVIVEESSFYRPKHIYYISDPDIANGDAHHRICMAVDDEGTVSLACCTTKGQKRLEYIKNKKWNEKTLVQLDHTSSNNKFDSPTHVDCNNVAHFSLEELDELDSNFRIRVTGTISDDEYKALLQGFLLSDQIDSYFQFDCNNIIQSLD